MFGLLLLLLFSLPLLLALYLFFFPRRRRRQLPPGPAVYPIVGNLLWLRNSFMASESVARGLQHKYGQILTLHIGAHPSIYVFDRNLAHKFLVQHGAVFASRPSASATANNRIINSSVYGPVWRLLRRNLMSEILHPSRIKMYSDARSWVLGVVFDMVRKQSEEDGVVVVKEVLHYAMFCLLVFMCFGHKLEEKMIRDMESVQRDLLRNYGKMQVFRYIPKIAPYLFAARLKTLMDIRKRQKEIFLPLINSRRDMKRKKKSDCFDYCYVDSLFDLELPEDEGGRRLSEDKISGLCSEFLNAGTDTTSAALEWVMANVVKHRDIQERLVKEIRGVIGDGPDGGGEIEAIEEEDLQKMVYLKAVIMEALRRHPPAHTLLPHAVTEDTVVDGYLIPKDASINFMVADMGRDDRLYEEALEFRPERFLPGGEADGVDITGSRDIKMMPFGAGRRICPGLGLALLHLQYLTANLVIRFDWKEVDGEEIVLSPSSEKTEFSVVMKNPLRCRAAPR